MKRQGFQWLERLPCLTISSCFSSAMPSIKEIKEDGGKILDKESIPFEKIHEQNSLKWYTFELPSRVWFSHILRFKAVYESLKNFIVKGQASCNGKSILDNFRINSYIEWYKIWEIWKQVWDICIELWSFDIKISWIVKEIDSWVWLGR